jgi:hypothetical protein
VSIAGSINTFYHADVSDAHSGFRVLAREALDELDLESDRMEFASMMLMEASVKDLYIKEVPITYHEREGEANAPAGCGRPSLAFRLRLDFVDVFRSGAVGS